MAILSLRQGLSLNAGHRGWPPMRIIQPAAFALFCVLAAGCASRTGPLVLDPIGPGPHATGSQTGHGSLIVYSAFDPTADLNRTPYRRRYTDYQILSADGKQVLQAVENNRETLLNSPPPVELAAGS